MKLPKIYWVLLITFFSCDQARDVSIEWEYLSIATQVNLDQIGFDVDGIGHIVGGDTWTLGIYGQSDDLGITWQFDSLLNKRILDISFDPTGKAYAVGIDGHLFDKPKNKPWNFHRFGTWDPARGIAVNEDGMGVLVSGSAFGNGIIERFDSNFVQLQVDRFEFQLQDVVFSNEMTIHVAGYGIMMRSIDGGANWIRAENIVGDFFQEIQFIDENIGYAVGAGGSIIKTEDAGGHWEFIRTGKNWTVSDEPFRALFFIDELEGYIAGNNGSLFYTENGGVSWKKIENLPEENFEDVVILNDTGFLVGEEGVLVRFTPL